MARINDSYLNLEAGYLFPEIGRRVSEFAAAHPDAKLIRLGIGDVTRPLPPSVIEALHRGVDEMARADSFKGYGPEQGYAFLRELIAEHDFGSRGVQLDPGEIFVSDGAKCDSGNIQEIFAPDAKIAVADPVYPVYVDTSVMAGRGGKSSGGRYGGIIYMKCEKESGFLPPFPDEVPDLIYLCFPNNPTGTVASRDVLKRWVDYAREHQAVILFDAAYEAFISNADIPHSIFEVEGAREVAIEFRSFSKTAGFTGTRCAYTIIPEELRRPASDGREVALRDLWSRRQSTKFNGVSYPIQVGAAAIYTDEGKAEVRALVDYYMENARAIREGLEGCGFSVFGGVDSPYIWFETPEGLGSWEFFDRLLNESHVVGTPGSGFGPAGEGYFRLSAFGNRESVEEAIGRIRQRWGT